VLGNEGQNDDVDKSRATQARSTAYSNNNKSRATQGRSKSYDDVVKSGQPKKNNNKMSNMGRLI
jgi:hypothetical protein